MSEFQTRSALVRYLAAVILAQLERTTLNTAADMHGGIGNHFSFHFSDKWNSFEAKLFLL
jgi:hypothetical protein